MPDTRIVTASVKENVAYMNQILPVKDSFDLVQRDLVIGEREASFFFIDGFMKDEVMLKIMDSFLSVTKGDMPGSATGFARQCLPYVEVDTVSDFDQVLRNLLSGTTCLFIDGYESCIVIDCRTYPARNVGEPEKDKSLRGSRDGFVETIVFNTALIRRRIRDPHLVMQMLEIGTSSRTDVALCYMSDRADEALLKNITKKLQAIHTDDLRMNQQSLAEELFRRKWFNPFPKFKFTERPDTAAACLLEGKVVILVDNSPSAMILPHLYPGYHRGGQRLLLPHPDSGLPEILQRAHHLPDGLPYTGLSPVHAEPGLAAGGLSLCGYPGHGEHPSCVPTPHAGAGH